LSGLEINRTQCGSGLAREGGVSGSINVGWKATFASKPAPTGVSGVLKIAFDQQDQLNSMEWFVWANGSIA
jgi:hypothetical protein